MFDFFMFPPYAHTACGFSVIFCLIGCSMISSDEFPLDPFSKNSNEATAIPALGAQDDFFFENVSDAIFIHDVAGNLLKVNQIACKRLGYTYDELVKFQVSELESPDNAVMFLDRIKTLEQKGNLVIESRLRHKDGSFIPVEVNARLFHYNGQVTILSVIRDMTERKRAEEELRQQTERLVVAQEQTARALGLLETLIANAPIGICFYDTEMRYLQINPCLAEMNDMRVEEPLGKTEAEALPGFVTTIEPLLKVVLATGKAVLNVEIAGELGSAPGQIVYRQVSYYPVWDAFGNILGVGGIVKDITQIKQTEHALRQAEEKYRNIFENAVEGIFQSTIDGRYLSVNSAMARIHGYSSPEDMITTVGNDIVHKIHVDPGRRAEFIQSVEKHGFVQDFQAPNLRKDGELIWTSTNARAVTDANGNLLYIEGFVEDVTERRRTLEALRKSEERFIAQFKGIPIPTLTWKRVDHDFVLIDYNDATYKMTDGKIVNLINGTAKELYGDNPNIPADLEKCYYERSTIRRELTMQMRTTGDVVDIIATYAFITPDLVIAHMEDVTQRKQAEIELRNSEARYRMLMEQAADGITVIDSTSRIIDTNSAVSTLLGYTREELLSMMISDILAPGSLLRVPIPFDDLRQGKTVVIERLMRRKDGTLVPVEVRTKMISDGIFQGILRDISERKALENALKAMLESQRKWNADLEDNVRAKTAELQKLSETRDKLLRQIIVAQEEEHRRLARELHDETSQSLTALIANLAVVQSLPASKAKARLAEVRTSVVDILKGVNQIVLDLRPTLLDDYGLMPALSWYANKRLGSNVRVEITLSEPELRLPSTIETTLFRIGQEALANVAKHAQATRVQITLVCAENKKRVTLQVADNGVGFSTDRVKQQNQNDRPHLGLLGMQERVELIDGQLQIETAPGKGTAILASVPLNDSSVAE